MADPVIEFKTLARKDAFKRMDQELESLLATAPKERQAEANLHVKSFKELFGRFLEDTGPSVEWEKIKPPPEGSTQKQCKGTIHRQCMYDRLQSIPVPV